MILPTSVPSTCSGAKGSPPPPGRVLVVLPPSHKCANLDRILNLARKAFCDQSLSLIDLSLRFAKVSREDLVPMDAASAAHNGTGKTNGVSQREDGELDSDDYDDGDQPIGSLPPPTFSSVPTQPTVAAKQHRIHVSNLSPACAESELLALLPKGIVPEETLMHSPGPRGPNKEIVRSVTFIFNTEVEAAKCYKWIQDQRNKGELYKVTLPNLKISIPTVPNLKLADQPVPIMVKTKSPAAPVAVQPASSVKSIPKVVATSVPCSTHSAVADPTAKASHSIPEPPPGAPSILVSNLLPTLTDTQILTSLVPHPIKLAGAELKPARLVGPKKELVRSVKLAFKSLADAYKCHDWIKEHAVEKGTLEKLVIKNTKISVTRPPPPPKSAAAAKQPSAASTVKSPTNDNDKSPAMKNTDHPMPPRPDLPDPSTLSPASPDMHRLHIANLHPSLSDLRILSLLPPDVPLAGATLYPPRPIGPRDINMRSVTFAFKDHESAQTTYEWIKEYDAGGIAPQVAAVKNIKVWVSRVVGPGETLREAAAAAAAAGGDNAVVGDKAKTATGKPKATGSAPASRSQSRASVRTPQVPASSATAAAAADVGDVEASVTVNGINPDSPVTTVMGAILDPVRGHVDPIRILQTGVKPLDGNGPNARGLQFVFDSQDKAKQFIVHMRQGIREGWFKEISVVGSDLRVMRG